MFNVKDPAFTAYVVTALVLCVHMILLDSFGGAARARSKTVVNREDASTVAKGADIVETDPESVARVMRAHRNLLANGVPFLLLALIWQAFSPSFTQVAVVGAVFVVARFAHSIAYVNAVQPYRTISFVIGQTAMGVVIVQIVRALLA